VSLLLVCSGGGHLKQLHQLADRLPWGELDRTWVTFDTGLSRGLLAGEDVRYATYAAPRDVANIARNGVLALRLLAQRRWTAVVSTGSSLAVNFLPLAAALGVPAYFIETAARAAGPSMTGRILGPVPRVRTYTQYPAWARGRWAYAGSIFESFEPGPRREPQPLRSAVVTLGTTESYGFRRMLEPLVPLLDGAAVTWQTGMTDLAGLRIDGRPSVPHPELVAAVQSADVVVGHAGTGAALTALEAGRCPVLVPRLARHGEHVDDHQVQVAADLHRRGLAIACPPEELTADVLAEAAQRSVHRLAAPSPLRLRSGAA
jgi:UDP-N-acetylglucosamine transferase subunit ALG13